MGEQVFRIIPDHGDGAIPLQLLTELGRKSLREALRDPSLTLSLSDHQYIWLRLQSTALHPTVVDKYLTAACNALCVFLHCASQSLHPEIRAFSLSRQVWFQAFHVVRRAFNDGKTKPAMQVLDMLLDLLHQHEDKTVARAILQEVVDQMVGVVITGQPATRLKEACTLLSYLLRRAYDLVPLDLYFNGHTAAAEAEFNKRCHLSGITPWTANNEYEEHLGRFCLALLWLASSSDTRTAAVKLFTFLCSKNDKIDLTGNISIAGTAIETYLQVNQDALKDFSTELFPAVLNDEGQFHRFLRQFDPSLDFSLGRLSIYLSIIQVGLSKKFIKEADLPHMVNSVIRGRVPFHESYEDYGGFRYGMMCDQTMVRLQVLNLLVPSSTASAVVPTEVLQCLVDSVKHLQNESDPLYRDEYLSIFRRLISRLDKSGRAARQSSSQVSNPYTGSDISYAAFWKQWIAQECIELLPQASYQRHILALQILQLSFPFLKGDDGLSVPLELMRTLAMALFNLIFDAFEDVRSCSAELLIKLHEINPSLFMDMFQGRRILEFSKNLSASTNRADHADALGRLFMIEVYTCQSDSTFDTIVLDLKKHLSNTSRLLPASSFPLHGSLLGLAYVLRSLVSQRHTLKPHLVGDIVYICQLIWNLVQADLCIDSPETEMEAAEEAGLLPQGPKDVLSYSWRALRDSSLVMQSLAGIEPLDAFIQYSITELCFEQLKTLRHRGAFSTVAQTFHLFCQKSRKCQRVNGDRDFLEAAFDEIDHQSNKLTRRSAGIPSMFAALLDPEDSKQFFSGIRRLVQIATAYPELDSTTALDRNRLPQVHALNCLKDVMMNSRFRLLTESLVIEMLDMSAHCLGSDLWAIRNCGLMLFRACIARIGSDMSNDYNSGLNHSHGNRSPLQVAVDLLSERKSRIGTKGIPPSMKGEVARTEVVFAALDLLNQVPDHHNNHEAINDLIVSQFSSKLWSVRERAARLSASRTFEAPQKLTSTGLNTSGPQLSINGVHGYLICYFFQLKDGWRQWSVQEREARCHAAFAVLGDLFKVDSLLCSHPMILAAYLDLQNLVFIFALTHVNVKVSLRKYLGVVTAQRFISNAPPNLHLVYRATYLNKVLTYISNVEAFNSDSTTAIPVEVPVQELLADDNTAAYVIEESCSNLAKYYPTILFQILLQSTKLCKSSAVRVTIFEGMIRCLSTSLKPENAELISLIAEFDFRYVYNRDLWDSQIRLAALVAKLCQQQGVECSTTFYDNLISAVRMSRCESIEISTRTAAVEALSDMIYLLKNSGTASGTLSDENTLQVLLILYDFLNDDDEDVRSQAAVSASRLLVQGDGTTNILTGCPAALRKAIMDHICNNFISSPILLRTACTRLVGTFEITSILSRIKSVDNLLDRAFRSASDLFAEERQNLYIDDIAELENWAIVVKQCRLDRMSQPEIEMMFEWTSHGLTQLIKQLEVELSNMHVYDGKDKTDVQSTTARHPLGFTYNADVLIIFLRVITIARLLITYWKGNNSHSAPSSTRQHQLSFQLDTLRQLASNSNVHNNILTALTVTSSQVEWI